MNLFKHLLSFLYRVWFYILVATITIILFPLLIVSILKEQWYPFFFKLARIWAHFILIGMGFRYIVHKKEAPKRCMSYIFIANHTSMTDIMLMFVSVKNPFVFVGKKELAKIPLFGFIYKRTCILVDRGSVKSRQGVFLRAQKRLKQGLSICIFPEGGVPDDEQIVLGEFKDGAFRLAISHQIPIVPMTFLDNKKRFSYHSFKGKPGKMRCKMHHFIQTKNLNLKDTKTLNHEVREIILEELESA